MKLNKYNMSHNWITGFRIGQLYPVMCQDVTPGEVWHGNSTNVVRLDPLVKPTFMSLKVFTRTFYLPYRIIDDGFMDRFIGKEEAPKIPTHNLGIPSITNVQYYNMFGLTSNTSQQDYPVSAYAFRAYQMIWNKHFRQSGINESDLDDKTIHRVSHPAGSYYGNMRSDMQLGDAVSVDVSGAELTIPEIRDAWAMQRLQEHRAIYGDKYIDQLKRFGVNVPYGLVDEPVPVSSGRGVVGISEVVETADTENGNPGQMAGHGIVAFGSRLRPRKFLEPGVLMTVAYARPRLSLLSKIERFHLKNIDDETGDAFYNPEAALKSDAVVHSAEIYSSTGENLNFAYTDNFDWLRSSNDVTAGRIALDSEYQPYSAFRQMPAVPTLDYLQYVDDYDHLFQNGTTDVRADIMMYCAHRLRKLSPVRRKGRS